MQLSCFVRVVGHGAFHCKHFQEHHPNRPWINRKRERSTMTSGKFANAVRKMMDLKPAKKMKPGKYPRFHFSDDDAF